jgi:hypothetical protein
MKLKILIKYILFSIYITSHYAAASIAIQAERFMHRPVLHNFINTMHFEGRWQPWTANAFQPKSSDVMTTPSALRMHPAAPISNFILPGFGLRLDSFFLHDSVGTERCEDAIRAETVDIDGVTTTYLSVAYCLGSREKTFILGADRTSIIHIYKYKNNVLNCTYTALCPVRAEFGCYLNGYGSIHGREKEIIPNDRVAQSLDFNEGHCSLDFIREYSRQAAHIMIDTKENTALHGAVTQTASHHTIGHHTTAHHDTVHEGHFYYYDIAFHMANLAAGRNGLSERLYRRGVATLLASRATITDAKQYASGAYASENASDGYTTAEDSDVSIASHRGISTKECAGQIMRVCAFSTDFLITSWDKKDITSVLEQHGIDIANGRCVLDEKKEEFALIKSLHSNFTGVVPYFFDNEELFKAVYERKLNYSALLRSINSPKRKKEEHEEQLAQTMISGAEKRVVINMEMQPKKGKKKLKV